MLLHVSILWSFLLLNTIPLYGHAMPRLFTYSLVVEHLDCFHLLATTKKGTMNSHKLVCLWT